jgi:hypothetical protein
MEPLSLPKSKPRFPLTVDLLPRIMKVLDLSSHDDRFVFSFVLALGCVTRCRTCASFVSRACTRCRISSRGHALGACTFFSRFRSRALGALLVRVALRRSIARTSCLSFRAAGALLRVLCLVVLLGHCTLQWVGCFACEITADSPRDSSFLPFSAMRLSDSTPNALVIHLEASKTDPFREGVDVFNFLPSSLPVFNAYMARHACKSSLTSASPLFGMADGSPLTRAALLDRTKSALTAARVDLSSFSGISYRRGGATSLAQAGLLDHVVQIIGRWKSNVYTRYIHSNRQYVCSVLDRYVAGLLSFPSHSHTHSLVWGLMPTLHLTLPLIAFSHTGFSWADFTCFQTAGTLCLCTSILYFVLSYSFPFRFHWPDT